MQIADTVTSPEIYSGYSQVAGISQIHSGAQKWHAVGDERTFIFIYWSWYVEGSSVNNWSSYKPVGFYAGDFEIPHGENPKGWGLLAPDMWAGTLETVGNVSSYGGFANFPRASSPIDKSQRPVTQIPGEAWSENDIYVFNASFESRPNFSNKSEAPYRDAADFKANAQIRSDWFIIFNQNLIYRLRGIYNIYPWLSQNDLLMLRTLDRLKLLER